MDALSVAYYLIKKAHDKKEGGGNGEETKLTPLKLQKLLYFAQGLYLKINNGESLFDDPINAWEYGPVVVNVWKHFKHLGITNQDLTTSLKFEEVEDRAKEIGEKYKKFLDDFFEIFSKSTPKELVDISHNHKIWLDAYRSLDTRITQEKMRDYFQSL